MTEPLKQGDVFHQEYEIIRAVGRGGQGHVYAAEHITGRCALKVSRRLVDVDTKAFQQEARLVKRCFSGTVPKAHGLIVGEHFGVCDNQVYCKMDLLEGEALADVLARGALTLHEATRIALSVSESLEFAHSRKALHRDLKPENVFIEESKKVYVLDWGCLQVLEAGRGASAEAGPMCTPGYAPLEQYRAHRQGPQATLDLYALGVVYYEMLSGVHPWTGWCRQAAAESARGSQHEAVPSQQPVAAEPRPTRLGAPASAHTTAPQGLGLQATVPVAAASFVQGAAATATMVGPRGTQKIQIDANACFPADSLSLPPTRTQTRKNASPGDGSAPSPRQVRLPLNSILLLQQRASLVRFGGVPDNLWRLVESLLAKNPKHRPQTAAEVSAALSALLKQLEKTPKLKAQVDLGETSEFFTSSLAALKQNRSRRDVLSKGLMLTAAAGVAIALSLDWREPTTGQASPMVDPATAPALPTPLAAAPAVDQASGVSAAPLPALARDPDPVTAPPLATAERRLRSETAHNAKTGSAATAAQTAPLAAAPKPVATPAQLPLSVEKRPAKTTLAATAKGDNRDGEAAVDAPHVSSPRDAELIAVDWAKPMPKAPTKPAPEVTRFEKRQRMWVE